MPDMDPEVFRKFGYQAIDWIADYLAHPGRHPVLPRVQPGDIARQLPRHPPEAGEPMEAILQDFDRLIVPGLTHWNHPGFMAYFAVTGSAPGILGELLSAALNVNGMLWKTSPAATELEEVALDWLRQMLGLPPGFMGIITDTASVSTLCAVVAAREALGARVREEGMAGRTDLPRLCLYTSEHAHSSVEKAAITMGIGQAGVRKIAVDADFRMDPGALGRKVVGDLAAGWRPFCVVATVGTTSTTSIDPVPAIARICEQYGLWLHVDGAYGGMAAILPEMRGVLRGCDRADSIVVNPHKWLVTPIDCSAFYCRRPEVLRAAFSLVPEYLRTAEGEGVRNYMEYGVSLGRRFRALKLWMIIRYFGHEGLAAIIREHCRIGQAFAAWVDQDPDFERLAPVPFSTVCFRTHPGRLRRGGPVSEESLNRLNEALLEAVNATGEVFLSHTKLGERVSLRLSVGNARTTEAHVRRAWDLVREQAARLDRELGR